MPATKPKLRKREIALGLAAGALAAGGAALTLEAMDSGQGTYEVASSDSESNEMTYAVASFDEISNVGPQDVVITYGEEFSVRAEGPAQALSLIQAKVDNGKLTIGPGSRFNWGSWERLQGAIFYITMPKLDSVALAGSGEMRIDQIRGESFSGTIAGAGGLKIGSIEVEDADFSINGAGDVSASGTADDTRIAISGAGDFDASGLKSKNASISIGGAGEVALSVEEDARISIFGAGDVDITGPGQCSVTRMGIGDVRCEGGGGTD